MVVHVVAESYLTVVLLLAHHDAILGLAHQHNLRFLVGYHHEHLGGEETATEGILTEKRERTKVGHIGVEHDEWDALLMKLVGELPGDLQG